MRIKTGILKNRDLFNKNYLNAIITDSGNLGYVVPIKHTIGDYFLTVLDNQLYVFRIVGERIKTLVDPLKKRSFRFIQYDTTHYMPLASEVCDLENVLVKNNLPRVDSMLYAIFKILGRQEKEYMEKKQQVEKRDYGNGSNFENLPKKSVFTPHDIKGILNDVSQKKDQYSQEVRNLIQYLDNLDIEQVVTPVRRVADFLYNDLLATDPKFMGTVMTMHERADKGNKIITNTPTGAKIELLKIVLVVLMIGMAIFMIWFAYDQGWFDAFTNIGKSFEGISFVPPPTSSQNDLLKKYPTPEALVTAIDRGEVSYSSLPPNVKQMVDSYEPPKAEANP